jgi:hypothetical protein
MSDLGRVNLLVGTNNSGKTSVLEAIEILTSRGNPATIWQILWRRGERITTLLPITPGDQPAPRLIIETDVCHLFTGHGIHPGTHFSLEAKNQTPQRSVTVEVVELSPKERAEIVASPPGDINLISRLALKITGHPAPAIARVPLSKAGGMSAQNFDFPQRRGITGKEISPSQFITTDSLSGDHLVSSWGQVALKPEEEMVLEALRVLDNDIERIAPVTSSQPYFWTSPSRGGFMVKLKSSEQPVPIGSMGDGMWRMLAMSIAITLCKGGTLLVDEIDTGLHYTVMSSMWKLIFNAAKQFDVQVFATTHSYDCIYSLAQLVEDHTDAENPITVQRVEPGRSESVPFSEQELTVAAEREIEVR